MTRHFEREMERIKKKVLTLSAMVEDSVYLAVKAIETRDSVLGERVREMDHEIDDMEVEVEEECLKILALHQPVAIDLRFIVAVLKLNNDLERIGDLAVNIARRAKILATAQAPTDLLDFSGMAEKVKSMLRNCLQALVNLDGDLARQVCAADDEVDAMNRVMYEKIHQSIRANPEQSALYLQLFSVSRNLERIADHATNIAEDVLYMIQGEIVRHGKGMMV
ncbi:MAG: phosphate signaling complex protein PhoU [Deltaproteobacteria bacterium]|nr:phosphate signaling complex protein PhoU [Deltaproteobacteria bacterium]